MKIGIWLNETIVPSVGGGASYSNRLISLIDSYSFSSDVELCYVSIFPNDNLRRDVVNISQIPHFVYSFFSFSNIVVKKLRSLDRRIIKLRGLESVLKGSGVKIMYYTIQAFSIDPSFPFISTNWDIGHRSTFSFPELCNKLDFEFREHFYQQVLPQALMIICESETGKKEIVKYTNIGEHKIRVMPIFSGGVSSLNVSDDRMSTILDKIGLKRYHYFYYPAQYWAHKNHVGLLNAFKKFVIEHGLDYKVVFSGSDKGNLSYLRKMAESLGIGDNVIFLGFISEDEVYTLYKNATCLVMASHFGPTNMPPIEAMEIGCPVACSDLGGHREILSENAVYFNSFDYNSIYNALTEIYQNRDMYVEKICSQKDKTLFNANNALLHLDKILLEAVNIRSNWE